MLTKIRCIIQKNSKNVIKQKEKTTNNQLLDHEVTAEIMSEANKESIIENTEEVIPPLINSLISEYADILGIVKLGILLLFLSITSCFLVGATV